MQVGAFSTPNQPEWRWRIINYAGEVVEESRRSFATITLAVESGNRRLKELAEDRSVPRPVHRSTWHLRGHASKRTA